MAYNKITWIDGITALNASNLNHMEEGISDCSKAMEDIKSSNEHLKGEIERIDRIIENLSSDYYTLSSKVNGFDSDISEVKSEIADVRAKQHVLDLDMDELKEKMQTLETNVDIDSFKGSNGYLQVGGVMIQWGLINYSPTNAGWNKGFIKGWFTKEFEYDVYTIMATSVYNGHNDIIVTTQKDNNSRFNCYLRHGDNSVPQNQELHVFFLAIGR